MDSHILNEFSGKPLLWIPLIVLIVVIIFILLKLLKIRRDKYIVKDAIADKISSIIDTLDTIYEKIEGANLREKSERDEILLQIFDVLEEIKDIIMTSHNIISDMKINTDDYNMLMRAVLVTFYRKHEYLNRELSKTNKSLNSVVVGVAEGKKKFALNYLNKTRDLFKEIEGRFQF